MKRVLAGVVLILFPTLAYAIGPRTWGKSGTATTTNAVLTVKDAAGTSFGPASLCISNLSTTVDFFVDWTDGVAATTDDASNVKVIAGKTYCASFANPNVMNVMTIGIITASSTAAYNMFAIAAR